MRKFEVQQSFLVEHPTHFVVPSTISLKREIQRLADRPRKFPHQRAFGPLEFKEEAGVVWAWFRNKNGIKSRFMRVREVHRAES